MHETPSHASAALDQVTEQAPEESTATPAQDPKQGNIGESGHSTKIMWFFDFAYET